MLARFSGQVNPVACAEMPTARMNNDQKGCRERNLPHGLADLAWPWEGERVNPLRQVQMLAAVLGLLAGCSHMQTRDFSGVAPQFDPITFYTGHTQSFGVFEDRTGANPTRWFTTDCLGHREKDGALILDQTFTYRDGSTQQRHWRIQRLDAHRYEATANDVVGTGHGEAYGNTFHWEYTVALKPGNPLFNVRLEQWMYLQPDGRTMLNRGTVSKLGITVAQIAEEFRKLEVGTRNAEVGGKSEVGTRK